MPQIIIGDQYPRDIITDKTGFLEKARLHQSKYRAHVLNVPFDEYGNYLTRIDAEVGLNFYDDFEIFAAVKKRYPKYSRPLYANMLRSEHIGFNLFIPLRSDLEFGQTVFNEILAGPVKSIDRIEIEYAPAPVENYLNDRTSFDTYIEYTHIDGSRGIIGIEVKYTEHDYKLKSGSKQETDIKNMASRYYAVTDQCGLYKPDTIDRLISDKFRQVWRNQLLGESIILSDSNDFQHFTSLTIFPSENTHFIDTCREYKGMLTENDGRFVSVTYEDFISICRKHNPHSKFSGWLDYLHERYIVD